MTSMSWGHTSWRSAGGPLDGCLSKGWLGCSSAGGGDGHARAAGRSQTWSVTACAPILIVAMFATP